MPYKATLPPVVRGQPVGTLPTRAAGPFGAADTALHDLSHEESGSDRDFHATDRFGETVAGTSADPCLSGAIVHGHPGLPPYGNSVPLHEQHAEFEKFVTDFGGHDEYDRARATGTISSEWYAANRSYHPSPGAIPTDLVYRIEAERVTAKS